MAVKTYDHQIYHIAHPLMKKLIQQAIGVRKFQAIYPEFFGMLKGLRDWVKNYLYAELKGPIQAYFQYENDEELASQIGIILNNRRLVDQALGYIQTGQVFLHDEFLVKNIFTKQELTDIFEQLRLVFWNELTAEEYAEKFFNDPKVPEIYLTTLKKVLDIKGWYLPNLIPEWSVEQLFVDYMTVFLKYDKYKKSDADCSGQHTNLNEAKQHPTYAETRECLKDIFKHNQPLLNAKGAFIDFHTAENAERSSNYFGVNVDLDDLPDNLPCILSEFIVSYSARRIDYYRGGEQVTFKEGHALQQMSKVNNTILKMLDKLTNQNTALDRADSLISGLLALLYVDGVFSRFSTNSQRELESLNTLEMFRHFKFLSDSEESAAKNLQTEKGMRQQILTSLTPYKINDLVQKIVKLFEGNDEVRLELKTESGKKPTHLIFTIEDEKLSYELSIKGMKSKIARMLEHFFLNEEERMLNGKSENLLGLSAIFTPLFKKIN